jgi:hypothetical protein
MSSNEETVYALSDDAIAAIVKLIQFGFLSGTDVTDHFRRFRLTLNDEQFLTPGAEWLENFEREMQDQNDHVITRAKEKTSNLN